MRVGAVQGAAASEGMEATAQSKRTAEINIMAYIPLLDSAVGKELNAMTVNNKNTDQEKNHRPLLSPFAGRRFGRRE